MTHPRLRQLERLEAAVPSYLEKRRRQKERHLSNLRRLAPEHATKVMALAVGADPKPDEPLGQAWKRCIPDGYIDPRILWSIPGHSVEEKFVHVFQSAPVWLLAFLQANLTAHLLGVPARDLSGGLQGMGQEAFEQSKNWPDIPTCAFTTGSPLQPRSFELEPDGAIFILELNQIPQSQWSRQERRRYEELMKIVMNKDTINTILARSKQNS